MLEWFEGNNQIVSNPQIGDIVFFNYNNSVRKVNHVGLVIGVSGGTITTIEGNTSTSSNDNGGKVMKRVRKANIVGYARPKYDKANQSKRPTLRMGSRGENVVYLQRKLTNLGYPVGGIDGIFGVNTCNAVIDFQIDNKLQADGVVGAKTWAKIGE